MTRQSGGLTGQRRQSGWLAGQRRQSGGLTGQRRQSGGLTGERRQSGGLTGQKRQSGGLTGERRQSGGLTGQRRQSGSLCNKLLNHLGPGHPVSHLLQSRSVPPASLVLPFPRLSRSLLVWEIVSSTRLSCAALCRLSSSSVITSKSMTSSTKGLVAQ